jgi:hypothetical protein
MDFKQAKRNRKLDRWVIIVLLTSLSLSINFLITKFNASIDLTPEKKYSLSRESLALLNKMEAPVDIVITIKNDNQLPKVVQKLLLDLELLLENFEQESTKHVIQVHHINVDTPKIKGDDLQKYNITEPNLISLHSPNRGQKIIFRYQSKESTNPYDLSQSFQSSDANARQLIWESGFYSDWKETGQGILEPKVFRGEQVIIESILALVGPKKEKNVAYFTRGHGEASPTDFDGDTGFSEFRRIIEESNLDVTTIDLSVIDSIPPNAKLIIIAEPKGIFLDKEIANIRDFVNREDGSIILCIDPVSENAVLDNPVFGLRNILREWGIRCHDMLIHDGNLANFDYFSGAYYLSTYPSAKSHEIIKPLMEKEFRIFSSDCRPVESLSSSKSNFISKELLYSSRDSWALSGWAKRKKPYDKNRLLDIEGPVPIITVSEKKFKKKKSKIAVIGSSSILSNKNLKRNTGNSFLCRNIIRWVNEDVDLLDIPPSKLDRYTITMSDDDFKNMTYLSVIIPALVVALGFFVSWLRKEL